MHLLSPCFVPKPGMSWWRWTVLSTTNRPNRAIFLLQREVAALLRVSIGYVSQACLRGDIPSRHIGRRVVIPRQELQSRFPELTDAVIDAAFPPPSEN